MIVKDEIPRLPEQIIPRVITTEFYKRAKRPSFVSPDDPPNEYRLNPSPNLLNFNTISQVTHNG